MLSNKSLRAMLEEAFDSAALDGLCAEIIEAVKASHEIFHDPSDAAQNAVFGTGRRFYHVSIPALSAAVAASINATLLTGHPDALKLWISVLAVLGTLHGLTRPLPEDDAVVFLALHKRGLVPVSEVIAEFKNQSGVNEGCKERVEASLSRLEQLRCIRWNRHDDCVRAEDFAIVSRAKADG